MAKKSDAEFKPKKKVRHPISVEWVVDLLDLLSTRFSLEPSSLDLGTCTD
jgi:hypothetical protein